jgi:Ni/Co efflux regulator RcnB
MNTNGKTSVFLTSINGIISLLIKRKSSMPSKMKTWDDTEDKRKERERKERIQHPHMIKSRKHWDNEQAYWDLLKDQTKKGEKNE